MNLVIENLLAGDSRSLELQPLAEDGDGAVVVGRGAECAVRLTSPYVAPRHAELRVADGEVSIRHLSGVNGTYVNDRLLPPGELRVLGRHDVVTLPGYRLLVRREEPGAAEAAERAREYAMLEARLHEELLSTVDLRRLVSDDVDRDAVRSRLAAALDRVVAPDLEISDGLADHLVVRALRRRLTGRMVLGGRAGGGRGGSLAPWDSGSAHHGLDRLSALAARELDLEAEEPGGARLYERVRRLDAELRDFYLRHRAVLSDADRRGLARRQVRRDLEDLVFGLGPLQDLVRAPGIDEIMVVGRDKIFVEAGGHLEQTGRSFPSAEDLDVIIGRIVHPIGRVVNRSQPIVDARLEDGSRVHVVIPPVALDGPAITIRRFPEEPFTAEDLVENGTLGEHALHFLVGAVRAEKNLVISGGTGSGKTTLLNVLGAQIPPTERIVVIEDSAELQLPQPNLVRLEAKRPSMEGTGEIAIRDLVRAALRMRPDRIVVGECRGKEALDMLQAMNTGHDGSLTTAHANSPREMISRLEVMVLEAGDELPIPAIHRQIAGAVDLIVQIERLRGGARRLTRITQLVGFDPEEGAVVLEDVFRRSRAGDPADPSGLRFTGYVPTFIEDLVDKGGVALEDLFRVAG